jgi:hypothetical protein
MNEGQGYRKGSILLVEKIQKEATEIARVNGERSQKIKVKYRKEMSGCSCCSLDLPRLLADSVSYLSLLANGKSFSCLINNL